MIQIVSVNGHNRLVGKVGSQLLVVGEELTKFYTCKCIVADGEEINDLFALAFCIVISILLKTSKEIALQIVDFCNTL